MIAVDSSVLIDLLGDDPRADAAEASLRLALVAGPVVVCEVVVSEVTAGLGHGALVMDVVEEMGIRFSALDQRAAIRAGEMQR
jgi:predicted nucleic acid-binding protein